MDASGALIMRIKITRPTFLTVRFALLARIGIPAILFLAGCATTGREAPEQAYERFKREEFALFAPRISNSPVPVLSLRVQEVTLDGQVMLIHPTSVWANEIRNAVTNFFTALQDRHVFSNDLRPPTSSGPTAPAYRATLTFTEKTHLHGGSVAKGALVAGLSLGIFGNSAVKFDLDSEMKLQLTRENGLSREYVVTNTVSGENRPHDNGAGWSAARVRANTINVKVLAEKMEADKAFYAGQP